MTSVAVQVPVSLLVRRPGGTLFLFLFWSAVVHTVLISLAVVYAKLHEAPAVDLDQKPISATLVRQGTPRDEKLLPRVEQPPPPPLEQQAPAPVATPEPPRPAVPSPVAPPAPPPPEAGRREEGRPEAEAARGLRPHGHGEERGDQVGAADGDPGGDSAVAEGEAYYARLRSQITRFYDVSETIPDAERIRLTAQVAVFITPAGQLDRARLAKSSGNDLFDSAVLGAVKRAAPFSPPPTHLREALQKYGVVLMFRP